MQIIDLKDEYLNTYFNCLEEWSDEMKEAGNHKEIWYEKNIRNGLRVKLARDDDGKIVGMIQYIPAEYAPVRAKDVYYIYCIWVHGHKQGVGNRQKRGIGKALLKAAEEDARERGARGILAWGLVLPFFMRAAWFKKHGYHVVDKDGIARLLLKEFAERVERPRFLKAAERPGKGEKKAVVTCLKSGWCPGQNIVYERARIICEEFGDCTEFNGIDTNTRSTLEEFGISDALFIDGKGVRTGPPPSKEKIKRLVIKQLRRRNLLRV